MRKRIAKRGMLVGMVAGCLALVWIGPASAELTELWSRTYGGASNDGARGLTPTSDGGYLLVGYTYSFGEAEGNAYLVKTDATGREEWSRVFGGPGRDHGVGVCETCDGGYVVTGYTTSFGYDRKDLYLIKVDVNGDEIWSRTYGGAEEDEGWAVHETADGYLLIAGRTGSFGAGGSDVWILKAEADGDTLWTRTVGGAEWDWAADVLETSDGNYAVVGTTGSTSGNRDLYVAKVTPAGDRLWAQGYGSLVQADADWGWSGLPIAGGGLIAVGHGNDHSINDAGEVWLVHIDASGVADWSYRYGEGSYYEHGHAVCTTDDGGYLVCGVKRDWTALRNDLYFVKTDSEGVRQWTQWLPTDGSEWPVAIVEIAPGRYTVAGCTNAQGAGRFDMQLVNLMDPTGQAVDGRRATAGLALHTPAVLNGEATIRVHLPGSADVRLRILSTDGREIASLCDGLLSEGEHRFVWEAADCSSGVYYCVAASDGVTAVRRLTLLR